MKTDAEKEAVPPLPEWLEEYRVSEKLFTAAYEQCPSACRTALKTGLALASYHYENHGRECRREIINQDVGSISVFRQRPLDWAVFFTDASFSASARLCAAFALPVLANVAEIRVIAIGREIALPCLAACELCGINDVFLLQENIAKKMIDALNDIPSNANSGKICVIHSNESKIDQLFQQRNFSLVEINGHANIRVLKPELFDLRILSYAQSWLPENYNPQISTDCVYSDNDSAMLDSPLVLGPGCEGLWIYPGLSPDDFAFASNAFFRFDN